MRVVGRASTTRTTTGAPCPALRDVNLGCGAKCTFWETKAQPANPTTAQNPVNALRINIIELFQGVARLVSMKKGWETVAWLPLSYAAAGCSRAVTARRFAPARPRK